MPTTLDNLTYPFDPTGKSASNLITGEQHILTAANYKDYQFIVPFLAPYFVDSLQVSFKPTTGPTVPWTEGIDFYATHVFLSASRACAKPIAGSISVLNVSLAGVVQISYQTLGGDWTQLQSKIAAIQADSLHNPRITTWEQVVDMPATFPVIDHEWDLTDLVGMSDVVTELQTIEVALRQTGSTGLADHIADHNNPHVVTAAQVGLGNLGNFPVAAQADAVAGTSALMYMTPLATKQAVTAQALGPLNTHIANTLNPHLVTAAQVGLGSVQNYATATSQDGVDGTRDDLYMTPKSTTAALNNGFGSQLNAHILDTNNPHHVTADQVNAYTKPVVDNFLAAKLGVTSQAADSAEFNGMSPQAYAAYALASGAAADTIKVGGKTIAQFQADTLASGQAADSAKFGGQTPADFTTAVLTGQANDTKNVNGMTPAAFAAYVLASGASADSLKFGGETPAQFMSDVLAGKCNDTFSFGGMLPADFKAYVLGGTAANSQMLAGLSLADLQTQITAGVVAGGALASQEQFVRTYGETSANYWQDLGYVFIPPAGGQPNDFTDTQWFVAGTDSGAAANAAGLFYLRINNRGPSGTPISISISDFAGVSTGVKFGYTLETLSGSGSSIARIWMQTGPNMGVTTVTELAQSAGVITTTAHRVAAEPTGITYVTTGGAGLASKQDLSTLQTQVQTMVDNLTTAFNALAQQVNNQSGS